MDYNFGELYGRADNSNFLYPEAVYSAVVEKASYGRTKDGTKGQWTIQVRTTEGENAGKYPLTSTISVTSDNPKSLGIMFRHLAALGIPVPDPQNPQVCINGNAPFWVMGYDESQVAQMMIGRPVTVQIKHDEYEGVMRAKIRDWRPARPGAPTTWPAEQPQQMQPQWGQPQVTQQWGQPQPYDQGGYMQPPQPGYGQPQVPPGAPPYQAPQWGQTFTQQPQQGPPQNTGYPQPGQPQQPAQAPAQPQIPGAPPWAQPGVPGQGGMGEFTQQGQSFQPSHMDPGQAQPYQAPQFPQGGSQTGWVPGAPGQPQQGPPPQQGWQPQQGGQQWPGQPPMQPQQPGQPGPNPHEPPVPPWAQ